MLARSKLARAIALPLGALALGALLTGCPDMFGPLPVIDPTPIVSQETVRAARQQCQAELASAPAAVALDGVTDTTGGMSKKDVARLLTEVGLSYVEVALRDGDGKPPELVRDELNFNPWPAAHGAGYYARMSLGDEGDADCYTGIRSGWLFTSDVPVRPGSCLRVTYAVQPTGRYEISGQALPDNSDLWRWRLQERATGATLLSFTDMFGAVRRAYGFAPESGYPLASDCHWHGYAQLMSRLAASAPARQAMARHVVQQQTLPPPALPRTWYQGDVAPALSLPVSLRPNLLERIRERDLGWQQSWALAGKHGAWVWNKWLLLPGQNLIKRLPEDGPAGRWLAFDGELIFVEQRQWGGWLLVAGFDDAMRPLWRARMELILPPEVAACSPEIRGVEPPDDGDLHLMWLLQGASAQCQDAKGYPLTATATLRQGELRRVRREGKIGASPS